MEKEISVWDLEESIYSKEVGEWENAIRTNNDLYVIVYYMEYKYKR